MPGCDSTGTAERSYPTTEVRGVALRRYPASKVGAGGRQEGYPASEVRGGSQEEIPHASSLRPGAVAGRSYPMPPRLRPRAAAGKSNPMPEARGGGWEDQPHVQGTVAAWAQEGLEELSHVESQEGRR